MRRRLHSGGHKPEKSAETLGESLLDIRWEGVDPRTSGTFYKTVVQATLLFSAYTWVMTPMVGNILGGFHQRVA